MSIEHPNVQGPPDPEPEHCGRGRDHALVDHVEAGCTARAYAPELVAHLARQGIEITSDDQHDDCDVAYCTCDAHCRCACRDCERVRAELDRDDWEPSPRAWFR